MESDRKNNERLTDVQVKQMDKELERTGVALDTVLSRYQIGRVEEMTQEIYQSAIRGLKKSKGKVA